MKRNVGSKERIARIAVGLAAGRLASRKGTPLWAQFVLSLVSLSGLTTGTTQYCPVNELVGYNGYRREKFRRFMKRAS